MPSPKSGKSGTAIAPAAPGAPTEADVADPGKVEEIKARQRQAGEGKYGSEPAPVFKPTEQDEAEEEKKSWIEVKLVDREGKPVAGEKYRITLPDGSVDEGTLGGDGSVRIDGIDPGTCKIAFPDVDGREGKRN